MEYGTSRFSRMSIGHLIHFAFSAVTVTVRPAPVANCLHMVAMLSAAPPQTRRDAPRTMRLSVSKKRPVMMKRPP